MAGFIEQLTAEHGEVISAQLSQHLGVPAEAAPDLLPKLAPMILGGLQRQAAEHGPERVDHILEKHADENVVDNLSGFLTGRAQEVDNDPGLGGLLGDSGHQATQLMGEQLGIGKDAASKIIPMLAPVILGSLLKQRNAAGGAGAGTGTIMSFLDADGDGSILDDVAGMLLKGGLGNMASSGQQRGGGGLLSKVLGGLLGGKR